MIWWHQYYSVVFLLVWFVSTIKCTCLVIDRCSCRLSDTNKVISLWGIDDPNEEVFLNKQVQGTDEYLDYNPCTPFGEGDDFNCEEDIACIHGQERDIFHSAGRADEFVTSVVNKSVIFTYNGMKQDNTIRKTSVTLKCDRHAVEPRMGPVVQKTANNDNIYSFNLVSRCACPGACPVKPPDSGSNMSVGSILLTLFFTMFGAYLIFGHLFLKYHRNLDGESSIPNYEFWKELPTNIKEGFRFTKSMLCGTDDAYENI